MADPFAHKRDGSWSSKDGRRPWGDEEILEVLDLLENEGLSYSETGRRVGRSRSAVGGVYRQIKDAIDREDPDGFRDGTMPRYWWRRT